MLHLAIIGSGPAGCYLADQLLRLVPGASVDVLEKLPVPFGLIRYGVAPDHQGTKAVARVFDRVLARAGVSFFGNVEVGREVQLHELLSLYDAVVLAIGAERDRRLGIPGEDLPGVMGSGAFVNWYNGHPHGRPPAVRDVRSAVIIGNGNVASDVTRILAKAPDELAGSDIAADAAAWLRSQPLETIHVVGRRGAADAKFSEHELAELGNLQRARPVASDPASLRGDTA
ncbi:MAG TPA: FAD-dependent oxidoreductase, partial [Terriglobales bacterium]|nr:FAD-dependent oxidoreductase [Terriglobales bacterium]